MVTVGVDPHKWLLVACSINELGQSVSTWSGSNDPVGWDSFRSWTTSLDGPVVVGIEGAYSYGQGLARATTTAGLTTFDINPRWTARERRSARRTDKSDGDDALAVARITLREHAALEALVPPSDGPREQLAILVRDRQELLQDIVRLRNQVHARLSGLDPAYKQTLGSLAGKHAAQAVIDFSPPVQGVCAGIILAFVHSLARRWLAAEADLADLTQSIEELGKDHFPALTAIRGVAALTAGTIVALTGRRTFRSEAQFAAYCGVSPLEASSAGKTRHRLSRTGNRELNAVLYRIALTQARCDDRAKSYIARRKADGLSFREAIRCLKRFIARAVYQQLKPYLAAPQAPRSSCA